MSVGHPFDRDTNVSSQFYPSTENIKAAYGLWLEKIQLAKELIEKTTENNGIKTYTFKTDNSIHSIFKE